ncbi:hypothetical protein B0T17DRAFT_522574 [Bombardia bombarda]|uniref:Uncharacterized protein n=1 Tax=Bombardia bombarda TaxID=252184 RepID=A0AA40C7U1_9PEZI|nr:hypothetical protein B0T17DRAFT_522574 [Bombardia bombarda]
MWRWWLRKALLFSSTTNGFHLVGVPSLSLAQVCLSQQPSKNGSYLGVRLGTKDRMTGQKTGGRQAWNSEFELETITDPARFPPNVDKIPEWLF